MRIFYSYKGKLFNDIRDIVNNNSLQVDFEYLFNEYLPFQVVISKRTAFKGVTIAPSSEFKANLNDIEFDYNFFLKGFGDYLEQETFDNKKPYIAAVSGGIDSSVVSLQIKPPVIYSGYYDEVDCDETDYSSAVAKEIGAKHKTYLLNENDFLDNFEDCFNTFCSPAGGMGSVMEYAALKKALKDNPNVEQVFFGNGGDEIFMSYYFNYYVRELINNSKIIPEWMPNFAPSKKAIANNIIDFTIMSSLNRGNKNYIYDNFTTKNFLPALQQYDNYIDKLLYTNINIILPTLLHVVEQIARSLNVKPFNPLSNDLFIKYASSINREMTEIPKQKLRDINTNIPEIVKNNRIKRGFPMPYRNWKQVNELFKEYYDSFFDRDIVSIKKLPYTGINRYNWGIFQTELLLRRM